MEKHVSIVDVYLTKEDIGNPEYLAKRTEITENYQIDILSFPKKFKEMYRKALAKSKHGIAVCEVGVCTLIEDPAQIVSRSRVFLAA